MSGTARVGSVVIGVAGGSASGKTTVVEQLVAACGHDTCTVIAHDRYYRDQTALTATDRETVNYDHPDALETELLLDHLTELVRGHAIDAPAYDFTMHRRQVVRDRLQPRPVIVVEGILVLAEPRLTRVLDLRVFVDTPDEVRLRRRLARDLAERGRTPASVIAQYEQTVRPMHQQFVEPSRREADLVIADGGYNEQAVAELIARVKALLTARR